MPGVRKAEVDFDRKLAHVTYEPASATVIAMVKALEEAGYGGQVQAPAGTDGGAR